MAGANVFIFILVLNCVYASFDFKKIMKNKVYELKHRYETLYGNCSEINNAWNSEDNQQLAYPRGDKQKLCPISRHMVQYYDCSVSALRSLRSSGACSGRAVTAYSGTRAALPCGLCAQPGGGQVVWYYTQTLYKLNFTTVVDKDAAVIDCDCTLYMYNVQRSDRGVYRCQLDYSVGGVVLLEVVDYEEDYIVVKPRTTRGPYSKPPQYINDVKAFTKWSDWTECSTCGKVGRRTRYGICYIQINDTSALHEITIPKEGMDVIEPSFINIDNVIIMNSNEKMVKRGGFSCTEGYVFLQDFPDGVHCHSSYLPICLRDVVKVFNRTNEIMIAMCKVTCQVTIYKKLHRNGGTEIANNSADIYSLDQSPPRVLPPARDIVFAAKGKRVVLRCPGTTLRNIPMTWRIGNKLVVPYQLNNNGSTIHINVRDHLVIKAWDGSPTLFSCWQGGILAGTVRVIVWRGETGFNVHILLLLAVIATIIALRVAQRILRQRKIQAGVLKRN